MGQPKNNIRMDSHGRIINDAEHNRNDLQELVRLTGMTQPIMGFVTISSDDKEAGMKKVTREEFESLKNLVNRLDISLECVNETHLRSITGRLKYLEKSAGSISNSFVDSVGTLYKLERRLESLERLERLEVKPMDNRYDLNGIEAICHGCHETKIHSKQRHQGIAPYFECTDCGYRWY